MWQSFYSDRSSKNPHHERKKDYNCESCGKSFGQRGTLSKHVEAVYDGKQDYLCKSCKKAFSESGTLKRHIINIHENQQNQNCDACGKKI